MYRATVNATGQQLAVKKVDLEALGANLVRNFDIGVFMSCTLKREIEVSALHPLGCVKYRPVMSQLASASAIGSNSHLKFRHDQDITDSHAHPQDTVIQEAVIMKRQRHPHILELLAVFVDGSDLWMIIPLVSGGSLESLLQKGYPKVRHPSSVMLCTMTNHLQLLRPC